MKNLQIKIVNQMLKPQVIFIAIAFSGCLCSIAAFSQKKLESNNEITEGIVRDDLIYQLLESGSRRLADQNKTTALTELAAQLENTHAQVTLAKQNKKQLADTELYEECKKSVLIVGTLYKCSHCPKDHIRSASGFIISEEGIGVTSYHIFKGNATDEKTDIAHVAMDYEGNVFPITEVMAASKRDDIAIFRFKIDDKKVKAIPLGDSAQVGARVGVIAHPHSMYYSFTSGSVSRYYWRAGGEKMSITADFSQGSSGGPVINAKGEVVGIVSATLSLYNSDNNLQMVSKEVIPAEAVKAMITIQ